MKKIILTFLLGSGISVAAFCQTFAGSVTYKMDLKNLPAGVSPAMLEQIVPTQMVVYFKGSNIATTTNAGPFKKIVMKADIDTSYMILDASKTILAMSQNEVDAQTKEAKVEKPVVKKTAITSTIATYPCTMYEVTSNIGGQSVVQNVWVTDKIKAAKPKVNAQSMYFGDIDGVMLKMSSKVMGIDMNMEATEVSLVAPDEKIFELPANYTRKLFTKQAIMDAMRGGK